jgi:GNAT superfamily N-acetyltransferase
LATRQELLNIIDYWISLGADGFRVDMASSQIKNDPDKSGVIAFWQDIRKIFDEKYLPLNEHLSEGLYNWAKNSTVLQAKYKEEYPAHLHIDLTPPYHHKGYGTLLIKRLREHLAEKGVPGVMLTVGSKNVNAVKFYTKCGFTLLEQAGDVNDGEIAFGIKCI